MKEANGHKPIVRPAEYDLDELEELNPTPFTFKVKGKVLELLELPHKEYYAWTVRMSAFQETGREAESGVGAAEAKAIAALEKQEIDLLMDLFGPFNADLDRSLFEGLTERKLQFLLRKGGEAQMAYVGAAADLIPAEHTCPHCMRTFTRQEELAARPPVETAADGLTSTRV